MTLRTQSSTLPQNKQTQIPTIFSSGKNRLPPPLGSLYLVAQLVPTHKDLAGLSLQFHTGGH